MAKPELQIDQPMINSPHEEPAEYWGYDRTRRMFARKDGRRPAWYVVARPGSKAFHDTGFLSASRWLAGSGHGWSSR